MANIIIKATDANGETIQYLKMSHATYAEMAFYALTHDPMNQDCDWSLFVDGEKINWHYPLNGSNKF